MKKLFILILLILHGSASFALDISQAPIEQMIQKAPPIVMFVLDDSGSMDFEFMTPQGEGKFNGRYYLFPSNQYNTVHGDNSYQDNAYYLSSYERKQWRSRFFRYNTIFYNPSVTYKPWVNYGNADIANPKSHPARSKTYSLYSTSNLLTFDLKDSYSDADVTQAHYYTFNDSNKNKKLDSGESLYLVAFSGSSSNVSRKIYEVTATDYDDRVTQLKSVTSVGAETTFIADKNLDAQNFANWFTYYRKRGLAANAVVGRSISSIKGMLVGLYTINESKISKAVAVKVGTTDFTETLLTSLYSVNWYGGTPLRQALKNTGEYLKGSFLTIGSSPYYSAEKGGACQQAYTVLVTDGFWNDSDPSNINNADGDKGAPYADTHSKTLADVAMKYYSTDLNTSLANMVPKNMCDDADWQHMVTYTISMGLKGTLDHSKYPQCLKSSSTYPVWPYPGNSSYYGPEKIDDLWHTAVNGRGAFFPVDNAEELTESLDSVLTTIDMLNASASMVGVSTTSLNDNSVLYQATYSSGVWTGDVKAFKIKTDGKVISKGDKIWSVSEINGNLDPNDRVIVTTTTSDTPVAFKWDNLNATQTTQLTGKHILDYLRGTENATLRKRDSLYADFVHSSPISNDGVVYIGSNGGMIHAFNANSTTGGGGGTELFSYVPSFVFNNLKDLASVDYTHKFYVDGSPTIKKNIDISGTKSDILACGLNSGGKGYFGLNVTNIKTELDNTVGVEAKENLVKSRVLWEFPKTADADMGLSYSKMIIVRTKIEGDIRWVGVFGNGYNSQNGSSVLYVIDIITGELLKKIDTMAKDLVNKNGMSTPSVIDINGDGYMDYAYAGDLHGNLWKFDLSSESISGWKTVYGSISIPRPLFKARYQSITVKPDVVKHETGIGYMVVFGTGKYYHTTDAQDMSINSIYGIWDYGDVNDPSEYVGEFNPSSFLLDSSIPFLSSSSSVLGVKASLVRQTTSYSEVDGKGFRLSTNNTLTYALKDDTGGKPDPTSFDAKTNLDNGRVDLGWFMDLRGRSNAREYVDGERLINNPIIRNGRVIFVTSMPNTDACSAGGKSFLMELNAQTGAAYKYPIFDITGDGIINDSDTLPGVVPSGVLIDGLGYQPVILQRDDNTEVKLINTTNSVINFIAETSVSEGIHSWQEILN